MCYSELQRIYRKCYNIGNIFFLLKNPKNHKEKPLKFIFVQMFGQILAHRWDKD